MAVMPREAEQAGAARVWKVSASVLKACGCRRALAGQLGLALCRYVLKLPPVVAIPRETIVREVGAAIQGYIDA